MHASLRHSIPSRTHEAEELFASAEAKLQEAARAFGATHRLIVIGHASEERVARVQAALSSLSVHTIEETSADSIELALRRLTMQHVPRGHMVVLWLGAGMSSFSPGEARKVLRAIRKTMWRGDALLVGADENHPPETALAMCAGAAFATRGQWVKDASSLTLVTAD